jgi:hypothetical protein
LESPYAPSVVPTVMARVHLSSCLCACCDCFDCACGHLALNFALFLSSLQSTPWAQSSAYQAALVHEGRNPTGLSLVGRGDPTGRGKGFAFIREDPKKAKEEAAPPPGVKAQADGTITGGAVWGTPALQPGNAKGFAANDGSLGLSRVCTTQKLCVCIDTPIC